MFRLGLTMLLGLLAASVPAVAAPSAAHAAVRARATDERIAFVGPAPTSLSGSPVSDLGQFDAESALRAVFMTALFGIVVAAWPGAIGPIVARERRTHSAGAPLVAPSAAGQALVWLNTQTGVWHEQGQRWYGKTRAGAFVTRTEALAFKAPFDKLRATEPKA
jgi:hypothetical protein